MFCEKCGKEVQEGWKVCPNCGARMEAGENAFEGNYQMVAQIGHPGRLIPHRSFWKCLLLSFVTCGIYQIYVLWEFTKDMNEVCQGDGKNSPNYIVVMLLSSVTCGIYGLYWWYTQGERLYRIAPKYGVDIREKGSTILVWQILGCTVMPGVGTLVALYIMLDNMNRIALGYKGEVPRGELQKMEKPHPHLIRNILVIYGVAIASIFVMLIFAMIFATDEGENMVWENITEQIETNVSDWEEVRMSEEPVTLEEAGGFAQWEANDFKQRVRTDIIVDLPIVRREENNYAVSIGAFSTNNIIIMQKDLSPAKEWKWLLEAQAFDEETGKAYFTATLTYTGNRADNDWPVFIVSDVEPYIREENDVQTQAITLPVTVINNTGVDIYELYASTVNTMEWEEDILGNNILFAGNEQVVNFTFTIDSLHWDWAIVDSEGTMIEFYDLDFSGCSADGATLILEYDGENGYATLR